MALNPDAAPFVGHSLPPNMDEQASAQLELTASAERVLYAAAMHHYSVKIADTGKEFRGLEATPIGTRLTVSWRDPRPDSEVWTPVGPSCGTTTFELWDGPTTCLEMHASSFGIDPEKREVRGLWLYLACDRVGLRFWNMIIGFHCTGYVFPLVSRRVGAVQAKTIFETEMERAIRKTQDAMARGRKISLESPHMFVVATMKKADPRTSSSEEKSFPGPYHDAVNPLGIPKWADAQEVHWKISLQKYIAGIAPAPCMWVLKTGSGLVGCLGKHNGICPADHAGPIASMAKIEKEIASPSSEEKVSVVMMPNGVACANPSCIKHEKLQEENSVQRCGKCHNQFYCSVPCQKACWKTHKPHCRISMDDDNSRPPDDSGGASHVWVQVLPRLNSRRPFATLVSVASPQERRRALEQLIGGAFEMHSIVRGENVSSLRLLCRNKSEAAAAGEPGNTRGCGLITSQQPNGPFLTCINGRRCQVRGCAVVVRLAPSSCLHADSDGLLDSDVLMDFGNDGFNLRWGIFSQIMLPMPAFSITAEPGEEWCSTTFLPRNEWGEKESARLANLIVGPRGM